MLGPGSDKQEIARLEPIPLAIVDENASTANDYVDFILRVGRLLIRRHRERELYVQGATLQDENRALAGRTWNAPLSIRQSDHKATVHRVHVSLRVPPKRSR
jgi:hypothetical protein